MSPTGSRIPPDASSSLHDHPILDEMRAIQSEHFRIVATLIGSLNGLAVLVTLYIGRSPLLMGSFGLVGVMLSFGSVFIHRRPGREFIAALVLSLSYLMISGLPIFTNGGFGDPRTSLGLVAVVVTGFAAMGIEHSRKVLIFGLLLTALVVLLQWLGVLTLIEQRVGASSDTLEPIVLGFMLTSIFIGLTLTARLVNVQNRRLVALAEESQTALASESRFLSNMSHEIRNPLNGVIGLVGQALEENDSLERRDQLKAALTAGNHLRHIVDDVLDLKKMEEGQFALEPLSFDLHEMILSFRRSITTLADEKNITFVSNTDLEQLPRRVIGDSVRLFQVASNLFGNAVKFTPEGGTVGVTNSYDADAELWTFEISDTGIGMTPETIAILFDRFRQAEDGTTKRHQGAGLGLAISKQLLDRMGGTITVRSTLGEGSTFTVTVPLQVDPEGERKTQQQTEPASVAGKADLYGIRILCVDDSNINLKVLSRPLQKAGAQVSTALSGLEALERVRDESFDLVLSDISMPEMDGLQLLAALREQGYTMPVFAVTGNAQADDVRRYLEVGFSEVMPKPVDMERLMQAIIQHQGRVPTDIET